MSRNARRRIAMTVHALLITAAQFFVVALFNTPAATLCFLIGAIGGLYTAVTVAFLYPR